MDARHYQFQRMTAADLPLVRHWVAMPEVARWWELAISEDDLSDPNVAMWIVTHDGRPFAYTHDYDPHAWPGHHFAGLAARARGIDQFIGEPDMLGRGHGSAFVRANVARLVAAGAPAVGTDPHPDNSRAIRAYENAGFRRGRVVDTKWGRSLLMVCQQ
jgi:aminoglycoside 6'-N-acetyltransferase